MESSQKTESESQSQSESEAYTTISSSPLLNSSSEVSSDPSLSSSSQPSGPSLFGSSSSAQSSQSLGAQSSQSLGAQSFDSLGAQSFGSQPVNSTPSLTPIDISSKETSDPTSDPTMDPTSDPTMDPTLEPTSDPTLEPTSDPTLEPTSDPTLEPTSDPTSDPTLEPTSDPTMEPNLYDQPQEGSSEEQYQTPIQDEYQEQPQIQDEYQIQDETQIQEQPPIQDETQREITQEELQELQERELSLRSKILNQPLPCKKKQTTPTTYIEKIQVKTPLTDNEATISRQIKEQCKQAFLYFQPLVETTPLQVNTITECEDNSTPASTPTDEVIETKYKKTATQPLTQFLQAHIATPKQKNKFIQLLVHTHLQLLHEIQTLQKLDPPIIHFHLTPDTLQYNPIDATPVITDFRLAFTKTTVENPEENKDLFPPYENIPQYPFEVFLLSKLQEDTPMEASSLAPIAEAFAQQTNLSPPSITPYETTPQEIRTKAIAHHLTWDPYAIHHYIYSFMTTHQIPTDRPFMTQYKDLLVSYLTSSPDQRPSIETTKENIMNIFKSVPKKDYLVFLASLQ